MELSQKELEIQTLHTRLSTAEESFSEVKKRVEVIKESNCSKDQQIELLQNDIDTLRKKLESRNELLDQKNSQINELQIEKNRIQSDLTIMNEQLKVYENKLTSANEQTKSLEMVLKDRDCQLNMMRQRLDCSPSMIQQKQIQGEIDSIVRERDQLMQELKDLRSRTESERLEEVEAHRKEVRDLRLAIESLQSEISDRQVSFRMSTELGDMRFSSRC
ncbi:unnamed protein product [Soboliphyme baturini]|uniref:Golgin subfamily A member 4-like n=1 Tax=Soboliphyme baturini TaxID=241478 RepID=A0A183IFP9_9BILA|nr:unnamed protein product [Soboliphyme baturini]